MNTENLLEAAGAMVEASHAAEDYSVPVVELAVHVAKLDARGRFGRSAAIAAYALSTWSTIARDQFVVEADLPKRVSDLLAADVVESPEPIPVVAPAELTEADVLAVRNRALADLANRAERVRLRVLTGGAAKAQTYREKLSEVERLEAALAAEEEPDVADYPYLVAEVGVNGEDIEAVAALIRAKHSAWTPVNAAIEGVYFAAKAAIQAEEPDVEAWPSIVSQAEADMLAVLAPLVS